MLGGTLNNQPSTWILLGMLALIALLVFLAVGPRPKS